MAFKNVLSCTSSHRETFIFRYLKVQYLIWLITLKAIIIISLKIFFIRFENSKNF